MTRGLTITRLTPPGTSAIAALELAGPGLWPILRETLRRVNGAELPMEPNRGDSYLTRVEEIGEELMLVCRKTEPDLIVELHCHGGEQLVRWLIEYYSARGLTETAVEMSPHGVERAETLHAARILLDQLGGAFRRQIEATLAALRQNQWVEVEQSLQRLNCLIPAGEHVTEPFRMAIVGAPNVGKSSLVNALLGYQRSVVAPAPGTTRDAVTTRLALDGWTIELTDTAGLREAFDPLEVEGIERAKNLLREVDLCLWLLDTTDHPYGPTLKLIQRVGLPREALLFVLNKCDRSATWDLREIPQAVRVSAKTGMGVQTLCERIVSRLVPVRPRPGEAVPLRAATHRGLREAIGFARRREGVALERVLNQLLSGEEGGP